MRTYTKPPDGGFAWVIAVCCLLNHMFTVGIMLSMSVLYVSWLDQFGGSKGNTSWILSIGVAITFGVCPLPANLAAKIGFRAVGIIGALLTCAGLVISVFATSITYLILSIGVLTGLGSCFCYLPGVAVVALYFDKRRPIAMGIATAGTGLGAFTIAPLVNYLEGTYGWRGALLILAGLSLHMCISASLFRPLRLAEDDRAATSGPASAENGSVPSWENRDKEEDIEDEEEGGGGEHRHLLQTTATEITLLPDPETSPESSPSPEPEAVGKDGSEEQGPRVQESTPVVLFHNDDGDRASAGEVTTVEADDSRGDCRNTTTHHDDGVPDVQRRFNDKIATNYAPALNITRNVNEQCPSFYTKNQALLEKISADDEICNGPFVTSEKKSQVNSMGPQNGVDKKALSGSLVNPAVARLRQQISPVQGGVGDSLDRLAILNRLQEAGTRSTQHQNGGVGGAGGGGGGRGGKSRNLFASMNELIPKQPIFTNHLHRSLHSLNKHRIHSSGGSHGSLFKSLQNVDLNVLASVQGLHRILNEKDVNAEEMSSLQTLETNFEDKNECYSYNYDDGSQSSSSKSKKRCFSSPTIRANLEILKDKAFLALCLSNFLTNLAFITPVVYMVDRAIHQGIDKSMGAILISTSGASNIFGRLFFGWIFYNRCNDRLLTYILCLSACGLFTMLSALCGGQAFLHAIYAACFGCLIGMYSILAPLVTVEMMGVARLAASYSIALLFMGVATLIGPPLAGWLFDWTKSYVLSYVINGFFLLASGVMLIPLLFVRRQVPGGEDKEEEGVDDGFAERN